MQKFLGGDTPEPPPCARTQGRSVSRFPLFWLTQLSDSSRAVEYSGTFDRMERLLTNRIGPNPRWLPTTILEISSDDISGTGRPINFTFDYMCLLSAESEPHRRYDTIR